MVLVTWVRSCQTGLEMSLKLPFAGLVTEEVFYSIFSKFFPLVGDAYNGMRRNRFDPKPQSNSTK